jgi:hypothetical protein
LQLRCVAPLALVNGCDVDWEQPCS